jgi:hypothetical protein
MFECRVTSTRDAFEVVADARDAAQKAKRGEEIQSSPPSCGTRRPVCEVPLQQSLVGRACGSKCVVLCCVCSSEDAVTLGTKGEFWRCVLRCERALRFL